MGAATAGAVGRGFTRRFRKKTLLSGSWHWRANVPRPRRFIVGAPSGSGPGGSIQSTTSVPFTRTSTRGLRTVTCRVNHSSSSRQGLVDVADAVEAPGHLELEVVAVLLLGVVDLHLEALRPASPSPGRRCGSRSRSWRPPGPSPRPRPRSSRRRPSRRRPRRRGAPGGRRRRSRRRRRGTRTGSRRPSSRASVLPSKRDSQPSSAATAAGAERRTAAAKSAAASSVGRARISGPAGRRRRRRRSRGACCRGRPTCRSCP